MSDTIPASDATPTLLGIPREIRDVIYSFVFDNDDARIYVEKKEGRGGLQATTFGAEILLASKQMYAEAKPAFTDSAVLDIDSDVLSSTAIYDYPAPLYSPIKRAVHSLQKVQVSCHSGDEYCFHFMRHSAVLDLRWTMTFIRNPKSQGLADFDVSLVLHNGHQKSIACNPH